MFNDVKTKQKASLVVVGVILVMTAAFLGWSKLRDGVNAPGANKAFSYIIPNVPNPSIYNHTKLYTPFDEENSALSFAISAYWIKEKGPVDTRPAQIFFDRGPGNYITYDTIREYFDSEKMGNKGLFDVHEEYLSLDELKKYINPEVKTPLFVYNKNSDNQSSKIDHMIGELLIGVDESERKLTFHNYWLGTYEVSFDDYYSQEGLDLSEKNRYLVIQPKDLSIQPGQNVAVPVSDLDQKTKEYMERMRPMMKDFLIGRGANFISMSDQAETYFMKVIDSPDFEEYFPPFFKVRLYSYMGDALMKKNDYDRALQYLDQAKRINKDLNQPTDNGWPAYQFYHKAARDKEHEGMSHTPYFIQGKVYMAMKDYDKARESFLEATKINLVEDNLSYGMLKRITELTGK